MSKSTRVRTGCWTCKKRHRKCDESKPACNNCVKSKRECEGYGTRYSFDIIEHNEEGIVKKSIQKKHSTKSKSKSAGNTLSKPNDTKINSQKIQDSSNSLKQEQNRSSSITEDTSSKICSNKSTHMRIPSTLSTYSSAIFEDLEIFLLNNPDPNDNNIAIKGSNESRPSQSQTLPVESKLSNRPNPENGVLESNKQVSNFNNKFPFFENQANPESLFKISYKEENEMLKHFFKKLLPLLDGHPSTYWPDLALKYCDFDVARSCFLSLACIHMYESRNAGTEYYQKGIAHINNTMDHLIHHIMENNPVLQDSAEIAQDVLIEKSMNYFVILVLINVHILFSVLENGKSTISRFLFETFASICKDKLFYNETLLSNEKKRSIVVVLCWYDTVSAIVSQDCRLPYCSPEWYGTSKDSISTIDMMGCPGEIFVAIFQICQLRQEKMLNGDINDSSKYETIRQILMSYRDFVPLNQRVDAKEEVQNNKEYATNYRESYMDRLKCALCWSIAALIILNTTCKPHDFHVENKKLVNEFIETYKTLNVKSPSVTQMVWPLYAVGCECESVYEKENLKDFINQLYEVAQMGTLHSMLEIVTGIWESRAKDNTNLSPEAFLESQWLGDNMDYLPL